MRRICFILVAGLDGQLATRAGRTPTLNSFPYRTVLAPVLPAVTCTMQATLTTGLAPAKHGIIANGLYTHDNPALQRHLDLDNFADFRRQISFWEQSNALLEAPRFWSPALKARTREDRLNRPCRTAMLFWQQSMPDAADIILTPKPRHTPEGRTLAACWSRPAALYAELEAKLGSFPLSSYWGPLAGPAASRWILEAARQVWRNYPVDLQMVYVPMLDYNLQRWGPGHPALAQEVCDLDALLAPLVTQVRAAGATAIIAGDYAMNAVTTSVAPNVALRRAGLLRTQADPQGKLLIDFQASTALAMADHQIAHVYCQPGTAAGAIHVLEKLDGVEQIARSDAQKRQLGLDHPRSGTLVLLSRPDAWFVHDWWLAEDEKPAWQFGVDIHRKPGYDPRELFFDAARRGITQDPSLVKGSHGVWPAALDVNRRPVLLSDAPLPTHDSAVPAAACAGWLSTLLESA